jgi:putative CocE/NonD family hydrolase
MNKAWKRIDDDVVIGLKDGTRLSARIWRPKTPGPWPAVLEYHPYPKRYATARRDEIAHGWFADAGYVSVRVDMRGSGDSTGHCSDEYTHRERQDAIEVVEWLSAQDWCTGAVGMYGLSWGAFTALQLAAADVPALKAVAVAGGTDDRFMEDVHRLGGCLTSEHFGWAVCLLSFLTRPPDPDIIGRRWRSLWKDRLDALDWSLPTWLSHPARDGFWIAGFPTAAPNGLRVPALVAGGTADVFATSVLRMARRQPDRVKAVIGPWAHKFPHMGIPGPAIDWLSQCTRWFDRWLKEKPNGADRDPPCARS